MSKFCLSSDIHLRSSWVTLRFMSHPHVMCVSFWLVWPLSGSQAPCGLPTSTCKTQLFGAKYDPLHQPNQCSALLENWHTGSRTVSGAAHQASWPGATPFEDYIRPREATQHYCSSTCFQATPSNRPGVVRMRHKLANTEMRRSSICPENFGPCLCCVWPPQPCKVTPYHMFQTPNGP